MNDLRVNATLKAVAALVAIILLASGCGGSGDGGDSGGDAGGDAAAVGQDGAPDSETTVVEEPTSVPDPTPEAEPEPTAASEPEPEPTAVVEPTAAPEPTATPEPRFPDNTGAGVTVVILDRGIDYTHPDFLNPDGTTRIEAILDMTGHSYCGGSRTTVEYSREQINEALATGVALGTDDYNGHGTATAGVAAGNGSALPGAPYRGVATEADLLIVKATSEGAAASDRGPGEPRFDGCGTDALAWVDQKITAMGQPAVGLWNIGAQWGPLDGTSQISREIEAVFGPDRPGRVWVASSGDDGSIANHSGGTYAPGEPFEVPFDKEAGTASFPTAWMSGAAPGTITIEFADGETVGPISPGGTVNQNGVQLSYFTPGNEFYPWTSDGSDYGVWMSLDGTKGPGVFRFEALTGEGRVDLYGDLQSRSSFLDTSIPFLDHLVPGRLSNLSTTFGAVVVGVHVERAIFQGELGPIDLSEEGRDGELWLKSSDGPTRDGRDVLDVTAEAQNIPAALGQNSLWASFRGNVLIDSDGYYVRFGGTSAAGPMVVGTVALMLEVNPDLTATEVKEILRSTAVADEFTGEVPNDQWGHGKLDIIAAVEAAAAAG